MPSFSLALVMALVCAEVLVREKVESHGSAANVVPARARTTVIVLGSGTPIPDPERAGPSVAVVVDSVAYLFDAGAGVMRRAAAMVREGLPQLQARRIEYLFLTHLHSDHTLGIADVLLTPWVMGRASPLRVFGPPGTTRLVNAVVESNREDIEERLATAGGPGAEGWKAQVHDVVAGDVYRDARIRVRAFEVPHSQWKHAFAFRIDTPDRSIVISGDTRETDVVARACNGCDLLIHEVYSDSGLRTVAAPRRPYHMQAHTSATSLGRLATVARPGLLVLYHQLLWAADEAQLIKEVRSTYSGPLISSHDLQRF